MVFSRPSGLNDNAKIESFSGHRRQKCLNAHWFLSLAARRAKSTTGAHNNEFVPTRHCTR
ncbi:integrase core domain-containing protein [Burkholderia territorii]|uniref:integrase core domain-containing protein n=1 Tax=Burkholderia territorii TaxID=1503055 RepID=UPI0012D8FEAE